MPIEDIHKWLKWGYKNVFVINIITHWIVDPPSQYPDSYKVAMTRSGRQKNLEDIENEFYRIDSRLIKLVVRPNDKVEMHIYVKGPFNRKDWSRLQGDLDHLGLDILNMNLPNN